jgi:hypothetical protein
MAACCRKLPGAHGGGIYTPVCSFGRHRARAVVRASPQLAKRSALCLGARCRRDRVSAVVPLVEGTLGGEHLRNLLPVSLFGCDPSDDLSGIDWRGLLGRGVRGTALRLGCAESMAGAASCLALHANRVHHRDLCSGVRCIIRLLSRCPAISLDAALACDLCGGRNRAKGTDRIAAGGAVGHLLRAAKRGVLSASEGKLASCVRCPSGTSAKRRAVGRDSFGTGAVIHVLSSEVALQFVALESDRDGDYAVCEQEAMAKSDSRVR